jgi:hypothetical protein
LSVFSILGFPPKNQFVEENGRFVRVGNSFKNYIKGEIFQNYQSLEFPIKNPQTLEKPCTKSQIHHAQLKQTKKK